MVHTQLLQTHEAIVLLAAPVVDIDGTLFVQAGIFLGLVLILNPLLFKPWLATQARRAEAIEGAARKAVALREQADAMVSDYDAKISAAREKAQDLRGAARKEEDAKQAKVLADARTAAADQAAAARVTIAKQADEARAQLGGRVEELATTIADKLLRKDA